MSGLDLEALAAFRAGRLGAPGNAAPADQVTELVSQPRPPATPIASALRRTPALLAWLGRFPGRPRLSTRILGLVGLDRLGIQWTVIAARRELRVQGAIADPAGHLTPETDEATLPAITVTGETKAFLAAGDAATAGRIAAAAAARLLGRIAPRLAHTIAPRMAHTNLQDVGRLADEATDEVKRGLRAALGGR